MRFLLKFGIGLVMTILLIITTIQLGFSEPIFSGIHLFQKNQQSVEAQFQNVEKVNQDENSSVDAPVFSLRFPATQSDIIHEDMTGDKITWCSFGSNPDQTRIKWPDQNKFQLDYQTAVMKDEWQVSSPVVRSEPCPEMTSVENNSTPLNVDIDSFTATSGENSIRLDWITASEIGIIGFIVERQMGEEDPVAISELIIATGNAFSGAHYSYDDFNVEPGVSYWYSLVILNVNGDPDHFGPIMGLIEQIGVETVIPDSYGLAQNYPNPFNPSTVIGYQLSKPDRVTIRVYNQVGQLVRILVDEPCEPGYYQISWNAKDAHNNEVASGIYFYWMVAGDFTAKKRMTLLQ